MTMSDEMANAVVDAGLGMSADEVVERIAEGDWDLDEINLLIRSQLTGDVIRAVHKYAMVLGADDTVEMLETLTSDMANGRDTLEAQRQKRIDRLPRLLEDADLQRMASESL